MANCGCKPCKTEIPKKTKTCKPFSICVGNHSLIWDGSCASIVKRKYQIPNGTFTSVTFEDGCIVGVGQAPIPQYTPQACCDGDTVEQVGGTQDLTRAKGVNNLVTITNGAISVEPMWDANGNIKVEGNGTQDLTRAKGVNNLVTITNGAISVEPMWDANSNIKVEGNGTQDKPWKPSVRISSKTGNTLKMENDGLFANLFFKTTDTVTVTGKGTSLEPYRLDVKGAEAKLAEINKEEVEGNGFTIDKQGRIKADPDLSLVTNLEFDIDAFTVMNAGTKTLVVVDEQKLKTGSSIKTGDGITGNGTTGNELKLDLTEAVVDKMLDVINNSATLTQKLKTILGV